MDKILVTQEQMDKLYALQCISSIILGSSLSYEAKEIASDELKYLFDGMFLVTDHQNN